MAVTGYVARLVPVPARLPGRGATPLEFYLHLRVAAPPTCEHYDDPRNVVAVVTPAFQPPRTGWDFDVLAELCRAHTRVRVSGWLLYDPFSRPQVGRSRVSPWSIHPVTHLRFGIHGTGAGAAYPERGGLPGPLRGRSRESPRQHPG